MGKYFGTDGIRGEANKNLTNKMAYDLACYLGYYYGLKKQKKILVGKDTRISSSMFEASIVAGLLASGCDAYILGYCSTPALAYLVANEDFACGIMISASHNPFYDNGLKVFGPNGLKIAEEIEQQIEDYIDGKITIQLNLRENLGKKYPYKEGLDHYVAWLAKLFPFDLSKYRFALDLANGGSCYTAKKVFSKLNASADYYFAEPNGININNDCGCTHLKALQDIVVKKHYDFGLAFDGDADRLQIVNSDGQIIDGDFIIYLLAKTLKKQNKLVGNKVVMTVMSNIGLKRALQKIGIDYLVTPVGDKNVANALLTYDYKIGGEQSGHIINTYCGYFGDGVKTALNVLAIMLDENKTLTELCSDLRIYPQCLKNIAVKDKKMVMENKLILAKIKEIEVLLADEGRVLVRPSGTENLIRVMIEARSSELCNSYVEQIISLINKVANI